MAPNPALIARDDPMKGQVAYLVPSVIALVLGIMGVFFAKCFMDSRRPRTPALRRRTAARATTLNQDTVNTFPIVQYDRGFADGADSEAADDSAPPPAPDATPSDDASDAKPNMPSFRPFGLWNFSSKEPPSVDIELTQKTHACAICADDFTDGEDVRRLPCRHVYHPSCIDTWLLERSGTCPLWQVFLDFFDVELLSLSSVTFS
ncbi:hypothetical protein GQ53DRAFT_743579 [Thozetella sp. PMI_491]|nr:hypothetical protein GQ53DRAFT_743579 [Thozetella sp. PMI_491]